MAGKAKAKAPEGTVSVIHETTKEERTFPALQWQHLGTDPKKNGGWKVKAPKEAKAKEADQDQGRSEE